MNRLFVNVKVDREERPDVDAIYMDAVQAMTGRGGWPMTVFLDARRRAVLRRHLLPEAAVPAADGGDRRRVAQPAAPTSGRTSARSLRRDRPHRRGGSPRRSDPGAELIAGGLQQLSASFDAEWGGFGPAPKFPSTMSLDLVLRAFVRTGQPNRRRTMVDTTPRRDGVRRHVRPHRRRLRPLLGRPAMAGAALREDAVRPGAARPRVRARRTGAGRRASGARWRPRRSSTCSRDLRHPDGGFFSAEDADSPDEHGHGHEGLFHTWTADEVRAVLGDDADAALEWYEFTHPRTRRATSRAARSPTGCTTGATSVRPPRSKRARSTLLAARDTRARPGLDDKVLTEWNALMLVVAGRGGRCVRPRRLVGGTPSPTASSCCASCGRPDGRWHRSWHADGTPRRATTRWPPTTPHWSTRSPAWPRRPARPRGSPRPAPPPTRMLDHFWDPSNGGLFTTADDAEDAGGAPEGPDGQRHAVGQLHGGDGAAPPGRADRRAALRQPRRPDPAAARRP